MALSPRLELRQAQSLTLTPQLMQSIRLLQLSHLEINSFVEAELLRNPLLESDESGDRDAPEPEARETASSAYEDVVDNGGHLDSAVNVAGALDTDVENVYPEQVAQDSVRASTLSRQPGSVGAGEDAPDLDQYVSANISLTDHLNEQVAFLIRDLGERLIARNLIDNLDEAGYLAAELEVIAEQLGTDVEHVETVLKKVQACEPAGLFARNVKECLALQLADRDRLDPLMAALLDHLDLLAGHDFVQLSRKIGATLEDITDMLAEIRQLDPRPGRAFDGAPVQAIVADVFVRQRPDGSWAVELNSDVLPRVLVNRTYYASVSKKTRSAEEKNFLVDCLQTANWLTKSLDQRAQTILKVATEIVRQQDGFLQHGVTRLRPMTLKMVAEAIDMHESTVSRVTANKYLSTPRGLFEMKYFFTTALGSSSGGTEEHSAEAVRHLIRQMIDAEDPRKILSDDTIAERLNEGHGIDVARRTVAKYREGMNIPSSVIRRRQKKQLATAG